MSNPSRSLWAATLLAFAVSAAAETALSADQSQTAADSQQETPKWLQDYYSARPNSFEDLKEESEKLRPHWREFEKILNTRHAAQCGGPGMRAVERTPRVIYAGPIDGWAVSQNGAVAIASASRGNILIFPSGVDHAAAPPISIGHGFDDSMRFSNDSRFLAWSDITTDYIFDLKKMEVVWELPPDRTYLPILSQQWIGNDLLIQTYAADDSLLLIRYEGGAFHKTILTSELFPRHGPDGFDRIATSDQLGQRFLRGDKVYTSVQEGLADNAIVVPHDLHLAPLPNIFRAGDRLMRVIGPDPYQRTHGGDWDTIELRDAKSGQKLLEHRESACRPNLVTTTPGGDAFAILNGLETVAIEDRHDLAVKLLYNLIAPPGTMATPRDIAFLPDNRIVVRADGEYPEGFLLIYDPAHPN